MKVAARARNRGDGLKGTNAITETAAAAGIPLFPSPSPELGQHSLDGPRDYFSVKGRARKIAGAQTERRESTRLARMETPRKGSDEIGPIYDPLLLFQVR